MCNCNKKCGCKTSPCATNIKSNTSDITYNGGDLECTGISNNNSLNEVIQGIDESICDKIENITLTTQLVNIGTGEGQIYAGENNLGKKQVRTLTGDESIDVQTDGSNIEIAIDRNWLSQNGGSSIAPQNIVSFNTANPNLGSPTFDPNIPQDSDTIYWSSVDNSVWKWNGTSYVVSSNPSLTPFYYAGTTNDAGGNKTAGINRTGYLGIGLTGSNTPQQQLHVNGTIRQTAVTSNLLKTNGSGDIIAAVSGTDYLTPTGDASQLTNFPILNQNTTGNAATVTTNANLTGDVTSVGNVTSITNSGVTAGNYTNPSITVGADGRITSATNGKAPRAIADFYTTATNNTTLDTDLFSGTILANTLVNNGDKIHATYGLKTANVSSKQIKLKLSTSNVFSVTSTKEGFVTMRVEIIRNSVSSLFISVSVLMDDGTTENFVSDAWTVPSWTFPQPIRLTAQGTNTGDVTAVMGSVIYIPAAT